MTKTSQFEWTFSDDYSPDDHQVITINIDKFDQAWQNNPYYVPKDAEGMGSPIKYKIWESRYQQSGFVAKMPSVIIGDAGIGQPTVGFLDGRHRYSVYRDSGQKTIPVVIPKDQVEQFQQFV